MILLKYAYFNHEIPIFYKIPILRQFHFSKNYYQYIVASENSI